VSTLSLPKTYRWLLSALCLSLCFISLAPSVSAQEVPESLTVSPTHRKYQVDPGQIVSDTLTVLNDGKTAYDLLLYTRPYSVTGPHYEPNFTATPANADAYKWVQFSQTKFHLAPGASQKITYTLQVPPQADAGGHYGIIFAETQPTAPAAGTSVIRKKRVGMIIYATVNGNYKTEGKALGGDIPFWQFQPPLHTTVTAKNTGNTDFDDELMITVKDVFGNVKYREKKEYVVLPQTTRVMDLDWKDAPWFGLFSVEVQQTVLGTSSTKNGYVLMMPRFLPIIVVIVITVGGVYAAYRRRR
jgi:hypothetical protein